MIKCIKIDNLISFIFIQPLFFITINALDSDFIKLTTSKIFNCYQNLFEVFFKKESESLSSHRDHLNHQIFLKKNIKPIFDFIYNLFELELKILKEYIQDKLKKELIHSFISSFDFSILFVKKLDDNLRLYVDYRALNRMTIKNRYSIPLVIEIMNRIKNVKHFIKLDIHDIFNRICVAKEDEYKIVFHIKYDQRVSKSLSGWQFKQGNSKVDWPKTPLPDRTRAPPWEAFLTLRGVMQRSKGEVN